MSQMMEPDGSDRPNGCECPDSWALECSDGRLIESIETGTDYAGHDIGPCDCPVCHA